MGYVDLDQAAALKDLIALRGKTILVDGDPVKAFIDTGSESQSASAYGADDIDEEVTASFSFTHKPTFSTQVTIESRHYSVTDIEIISEKIATLTLEHD